MSKDWSINTGDLASHLGMTPQGLHWYESQGLISPTRVNSYRKYSEQDFCLLSRIRFYHQIGFGIKEVKCLIESDMNSIACLMEEYTEEKRRDLEKEQVILSIIDERADMTRNFETQVGTCKEVDLEPFFFRCSVQGGNNSHSDQGEAIKAWVENIPLTQYISINDYKNKTSDLNMIGIMLPEKYLKFANDTMKQDIKTGIAQLFPRKKALYGFAETTDSSKEKGAQNIFGEHNQGRLEGTILRRPITCRLIDGEAHAYWEVWAPLIEE